MSPGVATQNRQSFSEPLLELSLQRVIAGTRAISGRSNWIVRIPEDKYHLPRARPAFVITGADILQHKQISTSRAHVSTFRKPASRKLILARQVVLVIHLVLAIWIVEKDESAGGWRGEHCTWRGNRKGR